MKQTLTNFTPDTDCACSTAQNLWGTLNFSIAHILFCKKRKRSNRFTNFQFISEDNENVSVNSKCYRKHQYAFNILIMSRLMFQTCQNLNIQFIQNPSKHLGQNTLQTYPVEFSKIFAQNILYQLYQKHLGRNLFSV